MISCDVPVNLISFLVMNNPSWIDNMPNLEYKYVSNVDTTSVHRKVGGTGYWSLVSAGSKHWKIAHGWSYLYLPDECDFSSRLMYQKQPWNCSSRDSIETIVSLITLQ